MKEGAQRSTKRYDRYDCELVKCERVKLDRQKRLSEREEMSEKHGQVGTRATNLLTNPQRRGRQAFDPTCPFTLREGRGELTCA